MSDNEALPRLQVLKNRVQTLRNVLPHPTEVESVHEHELASELEILDEVLSVWEEMVLDPLGDKDLSERFAPIFEEENEVVISAAVASFDRVTVLARSPVTQPRPSNELVDPLLFQGSLYAETLQNSYRKRIIIEGAGRVFKTADALQRLESYAVRFRQIRALIRIDQAAYEAIDAANTAEAAAESSRRAAGEVGSLNLSEHFENYRKSERQAAEILRTIAVVMVITTVIILALLPHAGLTLADVLQRALIAVPAFGLAGYLAAESTRHRRASQWAATLKVQLLTVDAYVQPLGPDAAAEIRQLLAKRAFGDLPTAAGGTGNSEDQPLQIGAQAIVDKVVEQLKPKAGN